MKKSDHKTIFIGVAWPYVNGDLHIGHLAGYLLPADICARYNRLIGNKVLMVSGSDCFGTPITVEADKRKVSPEEVVKEYHAKDVDLFLNTLHLTYDLYTLTNTVHHRKVTQDFFIKFLEAGFLYIDTQKQYYSPTEKRFLPDRYVIGECPFCGNKDSRSDQCDNCGKLITQGELKNPISNINKEPVELKDTEHYFIDWPKLQSKIDKFVKNASPNWKDWVAQETNGWLTEGLKARAITRDIDWGVEIPTDRMPADKIVKGSEHKRIYVWFDAVIGYFSASLLWAQENGGKWEDFWYGDNLWHYYFMGKDNLVFHTLFWPGQLMTYDPKLHLPDVASINMFYNYEGKQFSKSRNWTIPIKDMVDKYGNDAVRFYITLTMPEIRDTSFAWNDFKEKNNGILVANLGNFIHRVLSLAKGSVFEGSKVQISSQTKTKVEESFTKARNLLDKCEFRNYLDTILELSSYGNSVVDKEKVWELKKTDTERFKTVIHELIYIVSALAYLINPLLPDSSSKLLSYLSLEDKIQWPENDGAGKYFESVLSKIKLSADIAPLYKKLED
jgi:methionyl-tRNA synthetase